MQTVLDILQWLSDAIWDARKLIMVVVFVVLLMAGLLLVSVFSIMFKHRPK
jgi:hypothetical protein